MKTIAQQLNVTEFPFIIKDKNGNEIYWENSYGYWYKREYDSDGNMVYCEHSTKYWYKRECNSKGKQIYYEDSRKFWTKREYDSNGNPIYYEDSNGKIIDNRPKPYENKVVEVDGIKYKLVKA